MSKRSQEIGDLLRRDQLPGWREQITGRSEAGAPELAAEAEPVEPTLVTVACRLTVQERAELLALADKEEVPYSYLLRWLVLKGMVEVSSGAWQTPRRMGPARKRKSGKRSKLG